jgi:hypothetical protein
LPVRPRDRRPAAYIVNTDPHYLPGEHWVLCFFPIEGTQEYFDSYGQPPNPKTIRKFLGRGYRYNNKILQNLMSTVCGQYTIYYIFKRLEGSTMQQILNSLHEMGPVKADEHVNKFVEETFGIDLNVYDEQFLFRQVAISQKRGILNFWDDESSDKKKD